MWSFVYNIFLLNSWWTESTNKVVIYWITKIQLIIWGPVAAAISRWILESRTKLTVILIREDTIVHYTRLNHFTLYTAPLCEYVTGDLCMIDVMDVIDVPWLQNPLHTGVWSNILDWDCFQIYYQILSDKSEPQIQKKESLILKCTYIEVLLLIFT